MSCEAEGYEEEEVRAENNYASDGRKFLSSAFARVWNPR